MSEPVTEFGDELVVDTDLNNEDPAVESIDDYGYVKLPTDVPPPPDAEQNPGFMNGTRA